MESLGPMQSFKTLYREHYGFVWATVRRHGVASMLVEDAVHDTFVVAYRRLHAFDGQRPRAWLYSIGRRVASNYRRTRTRREARHHAAPAPHAEARDLERTVAAKSALERFLATLSPKDRELFVLAEIDGLTGPELASALGRKLPTIYSRVRVLRQRFEAAVDEPAQDDRPQASMRGWLLLQPWLAAPVASGGSSLLVAVLAATVLGGVGVATLASRPSPGPPLRVSVAAQVPAVQAAPTPPPAPTKPAPAPTPPRAPEPQSETKPKPKPQRATPGPSPAPYDLAADTRLLREAKQALRADDPAGALRLLTTHAQRFPTPAQPDLRATLWVTALCAQGREAQARAKAEALLTDRPGTPLAKRLAKTCVGPGLRRSAQTPDSPGR